MSDFKLPFLIVITLVSCMTASNCQVALKNERNSKSIQSTSVSSKPERQIDVLERGNTIKQYSEDGQVVFGPHLLRTECPMNYELLDPRNIEATNQEIDQCTNQPISCSKAAYSKYRTIDGSCNNIKHPTWGKSDLCFKRILPFDYADNTSFPRASCTGKFLPNPRHISNVFHRQIRPDLDKKYTTHFMEWGQMVGHDLSHNDVIRTPESGYITPVSCCKNGPVYDDNCMSSPVPSSDPYYTKVGVNCVEFLRSVPCPQCKAGQRAFLNTQTGYHDVSLVYGSTEELGQNLRSKFRGMLRVSYNRKSGPMLPTVNIEEDCISPPHEKRCYHAGDGRSNQNPFLLTIHTYLFRHHNFICKELYKINPHWNDEKLYQEARKINIAIVQWITYGKYLPEVLGEIMKKEGINILPGVIYTKYDPELDASVFDEYATFAGRYGHSQIRGPISEIDPKTDYKDTILLRDYYYTPFQFRYGQYDKIAKGMLIDHPKKHDVFFSADTRNYLYRRLYLNETVGGDLAATSIVRGRDHGLPGYTYYLSHFFNMTVRTFDDLREMIPDKLVDLLEDLYESVHDIDVYSASFAEFYVPGGFVGPTIAAVLVEQYKRAKFGDRYWFEHGNEPSSFTAKQLLEIKRASVSRILCETTRITEIQQDAFFPPSEINPVVACEEIPKLNFFLWKE